MNCLRLLAPLSLVLLGPACDSVENPNSEEGSGPEPGGCATDCGEQELFVPTGCREGGVVLDGELGAQAVDINQQLAARDYALTGEDRYVSIEGTSMSMRIQWPELQTPGETFEVSGWAQLGEQPVCFDGEFTLDMEGYDFFVLSNLRRRDAESCTDEPIEGELEGCSAVVPN